MLDLAVAIPTLVGSILSMFAAGSILVCYLILPMKKHLRHTLILNLALADFFNSTNNTISGIYAIFYRNIPGGILCSANGWIGQVTVQGTDFSILFITVITVITLSRRNYRPGNGFLIKALTTIGIWTVPITTSTTGLFLNAYEPVSGNWCWIGADHFVLRYALGHGWRLTVILTTICLYVYLLIHIHWHFSALRTVACSTRFSYSICSISRGSIINDNYIHEEFQISEEEPLLEPEAYTWDPAIFSPISSSSDQKLRLSIINNFPLSPEKKLEEFLAKSTTPPHSPNSQIMDTFAPNPVGSPEKYPVTPAYSLSNRAAAHKSFFTRDPLALVRVSPPQPAYLSTSGSSTTTNEAHAVTSLFQQESRVRKLLLLNAYPIAYLLLWIPGIANRLMELLGTDSRVLSIMQASTQFVGLANAAVYFYNERILDRFVKWWWKV